MGLFQQIFGKREHPESYRSKMQIQSNRLHHMERVADFLDELALENTPRKKQFQFQSIFTTDTEAKAKSLKEELAKVGIPSEWRKTNESGFEVTGYSKPVEIEKKKLQEWALLMCELGEAWDCEFAAWHPVRPGEQR